MAFVETTLTVPDELDGLRVDAALAKCLPDYSRSRIASWIKAEQVWVEGECCRPKDKVSAGDTVTIEAPLPDALSFEPESIDLDILYEDEAILILNKPVGLVVHPGAGNPTGTLLNGLLHHISGAEHLPRAGIVHRLDKGTTGLMVVAKTLTAHTHLVRQLQARTMKRFYQALVIGDITGPGSVDAPIGRHPTQRVKMAVINSGKPAVTHYQAVARFGAVCTQVQCQLESGRTHQIRVHMAHIKHPIIGDPLYNPRQHLPSCEASLREQLQSFPRQALHAYQLSLQHPLSEKDLTFEAPLPQDFKTLIDLLSEHYGGVDKT